MKPASIAEKEFRYTVPSREWFDEKTRKIKYFIKKSCEKVEHLEDYDIEVNDFILANIFIRIDERSDYFLYFHSTDRLMHISQDKEVALLAFWICKYKPFRLAECSQEIEFYKHNKCTINEFLAGLLIKAYVCQVKPNLDAYFSPSRLSLLIYNLFNRDISKEAMIMYIESFINLEDTLPDQ